MDPGSPVVESEFQTHGFHRNDSWIPSKSVDSGFQTMDSGFQDLDSGFQGLTFAGFRTPDSSTLGENYFLYHHLDHAKHER